MKKRSMRQWKGQEVAHLGQHFSVENAVALIERMPKACFDETVKLSIHLAVDPKQSDQMVRGIVSLPNRSGKPVKVLVFTEKPEEAMAAGSDFAGLDDLIKTIQGSWFDFDRAILTTSAMKEVRNVARILGRGGIMPNPKSGTISDDIMGAVHEPKAGRVEFKMDKTANMAVVVGKPMPMRISGNFLNNMTLTRTMAPEIRSENGTYGVVLGRTL
jgi:large subunit ribosomal protein L1